MSGDDYLPASDSVTFTLPFAPTSTACVATAVRWLSRYGSVEARSTSASPEAGLLSRERNGAMERALDRLPTNARLALTLSGSGFSGRDIAEAIGRSEAATRTLMSRARVTVRRHLAEEEAE